MDILVRKQDGQIVAISGAQRLEVKLPMESEARVKLVGSLREITVILSEDGRIIEKLTL